VKGKSYSLKWGEWDVEPYIEKGEENGGCIEEGKLGVKEKK